MAKLIECPQFWNEDYCERGLFLAGGITGCPDWQAEMIQLLAASRFTLLNPRRTDFNVSNPDMTIEQINWEHRHLENSDVVLFWFPKDTLCPITLYELGKYSRSQKLIVVGVDPEYKRSADVVYQTKLERPEVKVCFSLEQLAIQVMELERVFHWL
jgi:hypothetical protein